MRRTNRLRKTKKNIARNEKEKIIAEERTTENLLGSRIACDTHVQNMLHERAVCDIANEVRVRLFDVQLQWKTFINKHTHIRTLCVRSHITQLGILLWQSCCCFAIARPMRVDLLLICFGNVSNETSVRRRKR